MKRISRKDLNATDRVIHRLAEIEAHRISAPLFSAENATRRLEAMRIVLRLIADERRQEPRPEHDTLPRAADPEGS